MKRYRLLGTALAAAAAVAVAGAAVFVPFAEPPESLRKTVGAAPNEVARIDAAATSREVARIATVLPNYPPSYLAQYAPYAIKGNVTGIVKVPPQVDDLGIADVFTDVVITVDEDLFGKYTEKTITVRVRGGDAGNFVVAVDGAPDFKLDEPVLVLVAEKEPDSIYGDNYYVAGMQHGKYHLDKAGNALNKDPSKNVSYDTLRDIVAGAKG